MHLFPIYLFTYFLFTYLFSFNDHTLLFSKIRSDSVGFGNLHEPANVTSY